MLVFGYMVMLIASAILCSLVGNAANKTDADVYITNKVKKYHILPFGVVLFWSSVASTIVGWDFIRWYYIPCGIFIGFIIVIAIRFHVEAIVSKDSIGRM